MKGVVPTQKEIEFLYFRFEKIKKKYENDKCFDNSGKS